MNDLASVVAQAQRALEAAGQPADAARVDAVVLARWTLGWDAAAWLIHRHETAPPEFSSRFFPLVERRARHEPIAYILGEREFYGRAFMVTRDVLIPRPETEFVVEEALSAITSGTRHSALGTRATPPAMTIVDVGTGSGCLAITLALEWPSAHVIATDISDSTLNVARKNAERLGAADRVEFRHGAFLAGVTSPIDLIVANPPYVAERDRASLPPDVGDFEPPRALFGGPDGLDVIRELLPLAAAALTPGGWLILEIGIGQISEVQDLIAGTAGLAFHHFRADLQHIPRVVVATAPVSAF